MKLRSQLILAFLLLSVLPLSAMTLYNYRSSTAAFQRAVETEAGELADGMGDRMERVVADLDKRMLGLQQLPYETLIAGKQDSAGGDQAETSGQFLRQLKAQMGEVAPFIRSLEYAPTVAARFEVTTDDPDGPDAGDARGREFAERMTIHLSPSLFFEGRGAADEGVDVEQTRVIRRGEEMVIIPGKFSGDDPIVISNLLEQTFVALKEIGGEELAAIVQQVGEGLISEAEAQAHAEERAHSVDDKQFDHEAELHDRWMQIAESWTEAAANEEAAAARINEFVERATERLVIAVETDVAPPTPAKAPRPPVTPAAPTLDLGREFRCAIEDKGQTVGTVRADIDTDTLLRTVLSETERAEGEIPFAMDAEGRIYTADPADAERLQEQIGPMLAAGGAANGGRTDNWVVVTRNVPPSETVFGIARPVGESMEEIRVAAVRNMGFGLGMIAVAMIGIIPLSSRMTRNLSLLTEGASTMARGDLDVQVPVRSRDEIGTLAGAFNKMGAALRENQQQLVVQERLRRELELCRQLQNEMLPKASIRLPFADVRAVSIPAREVGGDFFNYFTLPGGEVAVLVGDVSGKGVAAAFMMANLQATLRARLPLETNLQKLATILDVEIEDNTPPETYVTLFMGVIDHERGLLRYVNAGHNPQYVVRGVGQGVERMVSSGRPLGLFSGGGYTQYETPIAAGDFLFLFTDGLTEMQNPAGDEFGEDQLATVVAGCRGLRAGEMLETVEAAIREFRGAAEPPDDATMMALRISG